MRRVLVQLLCCGAVVAACLGALAYLEATRPADPPLVRGDALRVPTPVHELAARVAIAPRRVLPATMVFERRVVLRARVAGTARFARPALDVGQAVPPGEARWVETAGESAAVPSGNGDGRDAVEDPPGARPELHAREVLLTIDGERLTIEAERAWLEVERARAESAARRADVHRLEGLLALAERNLELHQSWYDRVRGRSEGRVEGSAAAVGVSEQTVEDVARALGASAANLQTVRGDLAMARAAIEVAELALEVARRSARLAGHRLADGHVASPIAGYLLERHVNDGEAVQVGSPLLEVAVLDPLHVQVHVPSEVYARFRPDMTARVLVPALSGAPGSEGPADDPCAFEGAPLARLATVRAEGEPTRRAVAVAFALDNPPGRLATGALDGRLPAGLACRVELVLAPFEAVLLVPEALVFAREGRFHVARVRTDERGRTTVEMVPVDVRAVENGACLVESATEFAGAPLAPGDRLATRHLDVLRDGDEVVVIDERSGGGRE